MVLDRSSFEEFQLWCDLIIAGKGKRSGSCNSRSRSVSPFDGAADGDIQLPSSTPSRRNRLNLSNEEQNCTHSHNLNDAGSG